MPVSVQIKCIQTFRRAHPCRRISDVGGFTDRRWKISVEDAIDHVEGGAWEFYVLVGETRHKVVVASRDGRKYLKAECDGETPDTLLALPKCPEADVWGLGGSAGEE